MYEVYLQDKVSLEYPGVRTLTWGGAVPKGQRLILGGRSKKILLFMYKVQICIQYINRYTTYLWY